MSAPPFEVHFWGVRGTVPTPGPATVVYGGNTACVEVRIGTTRLIFDLGTGVRELGLDMYRAGPCDAHIFLSHTHLDHVGGFPFFKPAYCNTHRFELWAGNLRRQHLRLADMLSHLMRQPLFPVPLDLMHAAFEFHDFNAGERVDAVEGVEITTAPLVHPGGATAYRIDRGGSSFAYVTDTEHMPGKLDANILGLIEGCDIVVYDATYTDKTYPKYVGWGHSTWQEGVRLCEAAGAKRLVTFHHDPMHTDTVMAEIEKALKAERPGSLVAREGLVIVP